MIHNSANYPHPDKVYPSDGFISIAVPSYCRPFYLRKLIDTLKQYADMPYELVIHDDGSPRELQDQIFAMRDEISHLSFNTGMNQGLPTAANKCISQCSSKYVLFLNDDCFFTGPCLRDICNTLDRPYVGILSSANNPGLLTSEEALKATGRSKETRFAISNFLGGGSTIAFRKDVYNEVGGWDIRSTSGQADNVFVYKILKAGYFKVLIEGEDKIKVGNFVYGADYKPTEPFTKGNDCSIPRIFKFMSQQEYLILNWKRREACQYWVDGERTIPNRETYDDRPNPVAGLNDIPYWGNYFLEMFGNKNSNLISDINWAVAARHGQAKWKDLILQDKLL